MSRNFIIEEHDGKFFAPDGRRAFPFTCPNCGHEAYAAQSLLMDMGMNLGGGFCSKCETSLDLRMTPDLDGDSMDAFLRGGAP